MGGYGSGKWLRMDVKTKTNTLPQIDIRYLKRNSLLIPGACGELLWSSQGKPAQSAEFTIEESHLLLKYHHIRPEGVSKPILNIIWFDSTRCNYGGHRKWFICPGCSNRVVVIFRDDRQFLCRKCCRLTYQTQCWDEMDRSANKARKIRIQLGASGALGEGFPDRPRRMHINTYYRLLQKATLAENRFWKLAHSKLKISENSN